MFTKLRPDSYRLRSAPRRFAKAAVLATPVLAAALLAPAKAAPTPGTFTRTFNGFTDAFAPAEWSKQVKNDGTGTVTSTTMTITATDTSPNGGGAQFQFGPTSKLDTWFDSSWNAQLTNYTTDANWEFTTGKATFDWSWSVPSGTPGVIYPFDTFIGTQTPNNLWTFNGGDISSPASYTTSGSGSLDIVTPDSFGFRMLSSVGGNFFGDGVATISNFTFEANYIYVPGPLPAAAAVAGFAWSRKLRRRLKSVGSEA